MKLKDEHWSIVVHGGAGRVSLSRLPDRGVWQAALTHALETAGATLAEGGTSLDAVEAAVTVLEDAPIFNAGRGAVFTADGRHELEASIMDGATLAAGAATGLTASKNPISVARAVMESTAHIFLQGTGADTFSREHGCEQVEQDYFYTEYRWKQLQEVMHNRETTASTVGAVARDRYGTVAAGTSTGGLTAKMPGRVADSSVIGAGTYASNKSCAVSGTGEGEYFIRLGLARDLCALVEYAGLSLQQAADRMVGELTAFDAVGGIIAVAPSGETAWQFNGNVMFRGRLTHNGEQVTEVLRD